MSIGLVENVNFSGDDIKSFKLILRTVLPIVFPAPNNTAEQYQNIKIVVPPNSYGYWEIDDANKNTELVCSIHHYIGNPHVKYENFSMISIPNNSKDKDWKTQNVWTEQSYQKVMDRVVELLRPNDRPKSPVPGWMESGDGSVDHGFLLKYKNDILYIAKKHVYYGK